MSIHEEKIKVCMYSYYFPPQYSGAAFQAISLARKLRAEGVEVSFFTVNHNHLPESDEIEGFRVYRINEGKGKFGEIILWENMWRFFKKQKNTFNIMHSHGAYLKNSFVGPLSKVFGKKSIVKISLADNDLCGLGHGRNGWLHKKFISVIDRYVSVSSEITRECRDYGLSPEKVIEIPNGVETERFCPASHSEKRMLRKKYRLPEEPLMLLYVGVIDERKNVKGLVEMWDRFSSHYPGFLVIVGPASRDDKDRRLYDSLKAFEDKLKGKLYFIQYTDKIENIYKMADVFILPSTNEGMPNVVLEAMSSGLPCLVNKVSGAEDLINRGNGLFFDVRKPETFIDALMKLKDKTVRSEMREKARQEIERNFSLDGVAARYIDIYKEMLST